MSVVAFVSGKLRERNLLSERRRTGRVAVSVQGTLADARSKVKVWVYDLSCDGAMVETDLELRVSERLVLSVPGWSDVDVEVRWVDGRNAGLAFAR